MIFLVAFLAGALILPAVLPLVLAVASLFA